MFYGIDLAKESFKGAILKADSDKFRMISCGLQGETFERFKNQLTKDDYVAVEASTNTFWFEGQIKDRVKEVYVLDPFKLSIIYRSNKKTDSIDAIKIAQKLKYHILYGKFQDEFPTIYIPSKDAQELRSLFSTYELLKREIVMVKNRIRSLLTQNGCFILKGKNISIEKNQKIIKTVNLPFSTKAQIEILINQLNFQEEKAEEIKGLIYHKGAIYQKEIDLLTSIQGISLFTAIAIMADIVDIKRFKNVKNFCSYLRAAPKIDSSGASTKIGCINRHSRKLTMQLMIESVNNFRNSSIKLNSYYEKKLHGKSYGKVRVALVRKMLVIIYHMLTRNTYYYYMDKLNHDRKMMEYEKILLKAA